MNNIVKIYQLDEHISSDLFSELNRHDNMLKLEMLDNFEQIRTHQLKDTAEMFTVDSIDWERVMEQQRPKYFVKVWVNVQSLELLNVKPILNKRTPFLIFLMLAEPL